MFITPHLHRLRRLPFGVDLYLASRRDPIGFMQRLAREGGDIVRFRIGNELVFLLNHPDLVRDTRITHAANLRKGRAVDRSELLFGRGLLTTYGVDHRRQRRTDQPAFRRERIRAHASTMVARAETVNARWRHGEEINLGAAMRRLMLAAISTMMFSDFDETDADDTTAAIAELLLPFESFRLPLVPRRQLERLPLPSLRRARAARLCLERAMMRRIKQRRRDPERSSGDSGGDLLAILLAAQNALRLQDPAAPEASDDQLCKELLTFFAGQETTSLALSFAWYLLARNPAAEARLHAELDSVIGERAPTIEDLPFLPYTEMVLLEAMRLYPPTWRLVRHVAEAYQVGEHEIPQGALIVVSQFLMHRDARFFPDPERFDPERFTPAAKQARHSHAYFPFGGGQRVCIGDRFAISEGVLALATIARRWRLRVPDDFKIELRPCHTLCLKRDVPVILERRQTRGAAQAAKPAIMLSFSGCPMHGQSESPANLTNEFAGDSATDAREPRIGFEA